MKIIESWEDLVIDLWTMGGIRFTGESSDKHVDCAIDVQESGGEVEREMED